MTITLTREEVEQLLEVFELFLEEAEDVTTLENNLVKMLRARLSAPEPEPMAGYRWEDGRIPPSVTYTTPPQREWQRLTAYEIQELHLENLNWGNFACAIEAKLKEKNT